MDELTPKNEYEERKRAKQEMRDSSHKSAQKAQSTKSFIGYFILVLILFALGYWFFVSVRNELPKSEDFSVVFDDQGRNHIKEGDEHPPYNSNPPSSGWHYANPALIGFYDRDEALFDEQVIHNLEHGDIWIAYHPRISDSILEELKAFDKTKVIITPRESNDSDISLVAWGRVDSFDVENGELDNQRIQDFITRYKNKGPERITGPSPHR